MQSTEIHTEINGICICDRDRMINQWNMEYLLIYTNSLCKCGNKIKKESLHFTHKAVSSGKNSCNHNMNFLKIGRSTRHTFGTLSEGRIP